jgi:hypothetical protein
MSAVRVTRENVARALDGHAAAGLIRGWRWHPDPPPGVGMHLLIDPVDGETIRTRTPAEAWAACAMLASAAHAILRMPAPAEPPVARLGAIYAAGDPVTVNGPDARELFTGRLVTPGAPWAGWHRVLPDGFIDLGPAYKVRRRGARPLARTTD